MNILYKLIKKRNCPHENSVTITNFAGSYIDIVSTPRQINRSERKCLDCGKVFKHPLLDNKCHIINYQGREDRL